jgi:glutamate/tyrosine decarboxylase-like PLP-dependent enzyme
MKPEQGIIFKIKTAAAKIFLAGAKKIPAVRRKIASQYEGVMKELEPSLKPYRGKYASYERIPVKGAGRLKVLSMMKELQEKEKAKWQKGFVSGTVYHGSDDHIEFLNKIYALHSQTNPLHSDVWPSIGKYEAEIVSMTAGMLGRELSPRPGDICGTVTSGGTESILLAMKTYRDRAREEKGITKPEMIAPVTAHAAFDKASQYFNIKMVKIPVDSEFKADQASARKAVTKNTVVIVGSAPCFPNGVIDPIEDLAAIAAEKGIGMHTDACLGGFILPWAGRLGYHVPPFDFRVPGVTSISADTHKYGYAAKGTSVLLYNSPALRHYQFYKTADWPGGLYFSPTFAGSRPGALIAQCWAAMVSIGEEGYMNAAKGIFETADEIKRGIAAIPELRVLGDPLFNISFASDTLNIYRIMERMSERGWSLNGLHRPPCAHICLTMRQSQKGIAKKFLSDLREAVQFVKKNPGDSGKMAPVYGMAATFPDPEVVEDLLDVYMDTIYKV